MLKSTRCEPYEVCAAFLFWDMNDKPFEINTTYYEKVHDKLPTWNKRDDWTFQPPPQYGRKPWMWIDTQYKETTKELEAKAIAGGVFYLLP